MSTSADCIAKVDLSAQDLEDLERRVRDYQKNGTSSSDAVTSAAKDMIKELQKLRAGYEKQLADKGLTPPAPAKKIEGEIKLKPRASQANNSDVLDAPKFSKAEQAPPQLTYPAEALEDELLNFLNAESLGRRVHVVETKDDLRSKMGSSFAKFNAQDDGSPVAFAMNGHAFLIADRIRAGQGRAVFMHEVGGHIGLERLLPDGQYKALVGQIRAWAQKADGSQESVLAGLAVQRATVASTATADDELQAWLNGEPDPAGETVDDSEVLAYFLEEAVKAGVDPTAVKYDTSLRQWMRSVWAAFKSALRALGIAPEKLKAQDVVDLAYGAAQIAVRGRWHGTAAPKFRKFATKFMGSGEGAQAYGWGLYFSELRGVGEDYRDTDLRRKARTAGRGTVTYADGSALNNKDSYALFRMGAVDGLNAARDGLKPGWEGILRGKLAEVQEKLSKAEAAKRTFEAVSARIDVEDIQRLLGAGLIASGRTKPEGSLYSVAFTADDTEMLSWTDVLEDQPRHVRSILQKDPEVSHAIEELEQNSFDNPDGGSIYKQLKAIADEGGVRDALTAKMADAAATDEARKAYEQGMLTLEEYAGADLWRRVDDMRADEVVSRYLDSIGIRGVRVPVRATSGGTFERGSNYVIFNEDNVITVARNFADRRSDSVQASQVPTRDTNLKRWFGDSVVKNADGSPKVMYHGTAQDIETFRPKQAGAIFVTDDPTFADEFAVRSEWNMLNRGNQDGAQNIIPVFVKAEKPFDYEDPAHVKRAVAALSDADIRADKYLGRFVEDYANNNDVELASVPMSAVRDAIAYALGPMAAERPNNNWEVVESAATQRAIKAAGFDSFYVKEDGRKNLAVYEPTQLKSATGNNGDFNPNDGRIQYSKAAEQIDAIREDLPAERKAVASRLTEWANGIADAGWRGNASRASGSRVGEAAKRTLFGFMTNFQLAEQFGERITALKERTGHVVSMIQRRGEMSQKVTAALVKWDALPQDVQNRLNLLMRDATMAEIHPDVAFDDASNKHLKPTDREKYNQLRARYEALGPGKDVYKEAKAVLAEQWDARRKGYLRMVDNQMAELLAAANEGGRATDEKIAEIEQLGKELKARYNDQQGRVRGPYFPLLRFGNYLAIGESAELKAAEAELAGLTGKPLQDARERVAAMKRDRKHYVVSAHDTRNGALAAVRSMRDRNLESRLSLKDPTEGQLSRETAGLLKQFQDSLRKKWGEGELDGGSLDSALEAMTKVYLANLPEVHALKRQAERRGIAGASVDMKRAFASAGQQGAFMASRMEFADALATDMANIKAQAKADMARTDDANAGHVANEMLRRQALDMTYTETPVQDWLTTAGYTYYLGASPAFLLMNLMQPGMVSVPVLAGRFGMAKAASAMRRSYGTASALLKYARYREDKRWDPWRSIEDAAKEDEKGEAKGPLAGSDKAHLRFALRQLMARGVIDEGLQHELTAFSEGGNQTLVKAQKYIGWAGQQVEIVNRLSTALAAYELALEGKSPRNPDGTWTTAHDAAVEYAYSQTIRTQMDYSSESTARLMREGGGVPFAKMIFQFRRFQQGMLYLLADNIKTAWSDPQERKQALATLGWMFATTGMMAGALGMPFVGTALWLASFGDDEDDPDGGIEVKLRNALADTFGSEVGTIIAKGLPAAFGADISQRVGLGDIASPMAIARFDRAKTGEEYAKEALFRAAGPAVGMGASMVEGMLRIASGDIQGGVEKIVPKMFADVSRGVRFGVEGMTDSKGNPLQVPLDGGDVFLRSIGVSPVRESNYYEGTKAMRDVQTGMNDAKGRVGQKYREAVRSGDFGDARQAIAEWNRKHPGQRITAKDEAGWRRQETDARKSATPSGIKVDKAAKQYENVARFAQS